MDQEDAGASGQEARLLAMLRAGGAQRRLAVTELYREYGSRIRRYYVVHRANSADAEEWTQDTFVRVVNGVADFRGDSPLAAWIWTIARNVMIDAIRKRIPERDGDELEMLAVADESPSAIEHLHGEELDDCVRKRFAEFKRHEPQRAQCIAWAIVDQLKMSDIATVLGRSVGATREYISQCRKKLRSYLEPCLELA